MRPPPPPPPPRQPAARFVRAGDALDLYGAVDDRSVRLVHVDIPYNLGSGEAIKGIRQPSGADRDYEVGVGAYDQIEYDPAPHAVHWCRVVEDGGAIVCWSADEQLGQVRASLRAGLGDRLGFLQTFVWYMTNPGPVIRRSRFLSACQFATVAILRPSPLRDNWPGQTAAAHNHWEGPMVAGRERRKVADPPDGDPVLRGQKPVALTAHLAGLLGRRGGVCLDPHAGTGSGLVGAALRGMEPLGFEIRDWWARDADAWVDETYRGFAASAARAESAAAPPAPPGLVL